MVRQKSKKGFTLIEMVVAMVVIVIVFGMVTMMSVAISGFSQEKAHITDCHEEVAKAQQFINNWVKSLDDAFNTNFSVSASGKEVSVQSGLYWFKNPNNNFRLYFESGTRKLVGDFYINGEPVQKSLTFRKINNVQFTQGSASEYIGNTVKCVISLDDDSDYTMLMEKESSKPGMSVIFSQPFERISGSDNEFTFVTSADWTDDLRQGGYDDLQNVAQFAAYDFSAAYQYSALSMMRVQVDHQDRMSLEAFTSTYASAWKVRLFSASGKVAYSMKLSGSQFQAGSHRLSFFIEEGAVLCDGTPIEPLGFTRKPGSIGTTDWHSAAELTFVDEYKQGNIWWIDLDTNIFWDEMNATCYEKLQYSNVRKLYGLSDVFGLSLENGLFITLGTETRPLNLFEDNAVYVTMDNSGANGTVRVRIGLDATVLRPTGRTLEGEEVILTFTNRFSLPDGTPLREENSFRCKLADYGNSLFQKAVSVSAAGEWFDGDSGIASGSPLISKAVFHMDFYIHAPWTDVSRTKYENLQDAATAQSTYGLSNEFLNNLYDRVFIGKDGVESSLRKAMAELKFKISLMADPTVDDRMILRLSVNTADMTTGTYPLDLEKQVFSIRFGDSKHTGNILLQTPFLLPDGTPVRVISLARPVAEYTKAPWLPRHTLSSKISSVVTGGYLKINITSNGVWDIHASARFTDLLTRNYGFSPAFLNSLQKKISLKIGTTEKTLAEWGVANFNFDVYETNGRWALQMKIKNTLVSGKDLVIKFTEGFVGPDGTTLVIPINYTRDGTNSWTGSTDPGLFFPNRTISIVHSDAAVPSIGLTINKSAFNGTAPYYLYGNVKLEGSSLTSSGGMAYMDLQFKDSGTFLRFAALTEDTNGWVSFTDLYGGKVPIKAENLQLGFALHDMHGKFTFADVIIADKNGKVVYSMSNDTTLYGVGDVRNVDNVNANSSWAAYSTGSTTFPIITRGDAYYSPSRVLGMTVNSGYTGGDASFIINQNAFTRGITYYVTGRIRTNITGKTSAATALQNTANAVLTGAGDSKYYGTNNGEWVAIANPDGSTLNFTVEETPKTLTTPSRTIGMGSHLNTRNTKMVIDCGDFNLTYTPGIYIVRGYYKVTSYEPNLGATSHRYTIGGNADIGTITSTGNQTTWKYFRVIWDSRKGNNLDFEFMDANGFMYLADLTIENPSGTIVYDLALDTDLPEGWHTGFPWDPGIWYFTRFEEHYEEAMDLSIDKVGSATPLQYSFTRTTTKKDLSTAKRTLSIHTKYGTGNGKITIQADQFKSIIGSGTYTVRGYYKVEEFTKLKDGACYEIGDGASDGKQTGTSNQTSWTYFELIWSPTTNLNFEFHGASGYIRLANVTIENSKYRVVYDMSTDTALDGTYHTTFPQQKGIWYITYFDAPTPAMDASISASSTGTPMQYKATISGVLRKMAMWADGNTVNGKMQVIGSKFASAYGAGTYTVSGYYYISDYKAIGSGANIIIGTGATSGIVSNHGNTNGWTYFSLQWNTSSDLLFEYWYATGYLAIGNLTFINSSGTIVYDLSNDPNIPTGYYEAFPREPQFWYWGYSGAKATLNMVIDGATTASPSRNADGHNETPIDNIANSAVKRSIAIHASNYRMNGKMVITSAQAKTRFGANKTMIVRGYYKVEDYSAIGSDPWWQIGTNANSGQSNKKTGNQTSWKYFKIYWNTNKDLNFEFWDANGYLRLANLTIEDLNGGVWYDMSTDTALGTSTAYHTTFPQQKGIWYFGHESSIPFMDASISAVTTSTPKQYTASSITESAKSLTTPKRTIGFGAKHKLQNGKMVITAEQAATAFGANKDMIVRGYYKVVSYTKVGENDCYTIGTNSPDAITGRTSQTTWTYFRLRWNTSKDLNFELWNANGFLYLANVTIEAAHSDCLGDVVYDLSTDANLYKDGAYYEGLSSFPRNPSIWYFSGGTEYVMDMVIDATGGHTPVQYTYDWQYLKFSMWYATGTMEIADLTIYHINNGVKYVDYSMATDPLFNTSTSKTNTNGSLGSGTKWSSWEWLEGGAKNFSINISNYGDATHPDSEYIVPKFTDSIG